MKRFLPCALLALLVPVLSQPVYAQAAPAAPAAASHAELRKELARSEDVARLEQVGARLDARGEHDAAVLVWQRLVALRPHLGRYKLRLAAAYAQQDMKSETYNALLELQKQGYAFDLEGDPRFGKVATTEVWKYVVQGFDANGQPFGEGEVAVTLPAEDLLIESIAWDPTRKQLLAGSARKGAVYRVDRKGRLKPLVVADAANGMWAVMDVAVDARRGVLWVASTAIPHFEGYEPERDLGRAGVFKFDLKTGRFIDRYLSPVVPGQSFFMSTLAIGSNGEVYAADGVNNAVYVVRGDEFKRLFHAPRLSGLRGMTVDAEGDALYFADAQRGIMGFDLKAGQPFDLRVPATLALGGAEGLVWWKDSLIVVQSGMQPNRIMKLKLSADGRDVAAVFPLEANKDALSAPTMATVGDGKVFVVANSQKRNYDRFGLLRDRKALEGTRIWTLDPEFGGKIAPAAIQKTIGQ